MPNGCGLRIIHSEEKLTQILTTRGMFQKVQGQIIQTTIYVIRLVPHRNGSWTYVFQSGM